MSEPARGPRNQRRGRGARERILGAAHVLFRERGVNNTGMDQLCSTAQVSKRTAYQHFGGKDALIAEYLRALDPRVMPEVFERADLTPGDRLLAVFESGSCAGESTPLCPFVAAAVEIADERHPARVCVREYKHAVAARLAEVAREAGVAEPELLGEQLALLLDGASVRGRVLGADARPTAAGIAAVLIAGAVPKSDPRARPRAGAGRAGD